MPERPLAVVTGASSGIGRALARCCAEGGYDLVIASDEAKIVQVAEELRKTGVRVEPVEADLASDGGRETLFAAIAGRPVDALLANAGRGQGGSFLEQSWSDIRDVLDLNVTQTLAVVHRIGRGMQERGHGRILITGSVVDSIPGPFNSIYNASKAFVDSFSHALRNELKDHGVSVTCLIPGATDTDFFERAGLADTRLGQSEHKADPDKVARQGYEAMLRGEAGTVSGVLHRLQAVVAGLIPDTVLARMHRRLAEPKH
ncbi:MAG: SDR family NAD(P)-dependent oxidoreductase [Alphaproteobacteria bacterium]|nr:SDR family NAD(P)-dependent oxidoreductase [Alphaproteobacteria bacterium]